MLRRLLLSSTAPLCFATMSFAQSAEITDASTVALAFTLDPVVVGSGIGNVASDTPQSVSVITQEDIDRSLPRTINDLFTEIPGVTGVGSERVLGERVNIRGIGGGEDGDQNRIITRIDGVTKFYQQYRMGALFTEPELYRRVEVLRGPASSTLTGAGAIGGVIELETRDASDFLFTPEDTFAFRQRFQYTSNGNGFLSSSILAARPSEDVELLGFFAYRGQEDVVDGEGDDIVGSNFDSTSYLLKGRYTFGNDRQHSVFATLQNWTTSEDQAEYEQTGTNEAFGRVDRDVDDNTFVLGYDFNPPGNDLVDLEVRFGYSDTEVIQENATGQFPSTLFEDAEYAYTSYQLNAINTSRFRAGSADVTMSYGFDASLQERVGRTTSRNFPNTPENGFISFQPGGYDENYGVFLQAEIAYDNGLTLIPGLRYEWQELRPDNLNTTFDEDESLSNEAFAPKLAVLYEINENFNVFGSIAQTERLPVLDEAFDGNSGNLDLEPERATTWEVGVSYSSFDVFTAGDQLVAKAVYFDNDIEDLISRVNTRSPFVNIDEATITGWELEAAYDSDRVFGRLAYSQVRGDGTEDGGPEEPLLDVPADELSVTIGTRLPQYNVDLSLRSTHTWRQDRVPSGADETPSYTVWDVFASWKPDQGALEGFEMRLAANNITDETYSPHLYGFDENAAGRSVSLSIAKLF
ncbi:MAG: TonB-dependent receptor [Pseudomonadota bacterium]